MNIEIYMTISYHYGNTNRGFVMKTSTVSCINNSFTQGGLNVGIY